MRKLMLAVLTVLALALASCSTAVQPVTNVEQQHQVTFISEQPMLMTLSDPYTGDDICSVYGCVLTEDGLEGEYALYVELNNSGYAKTLSFEPDQTYIYCVQKVRSSWRIIREE